MDAELGIPLPENAKVLGMYANGSLCLKTRKVHVDGDLIVKGDLILSCTQLSVTGRIWVGGILDIKPTDKDRTIESGGGITAQEGIQSWGKLRIRSGGPNDIAGKVMDITDKMFSVDELNNLKFRRESLTSKEQEEFYGNLPSDKGQDAYNAYYKKCMAENRTPLREFADVLAECDPQRFVTWVNIMAEYGGYLPEKALLKTTHGDPVFDLGDGFSI